MKPITTNGVTFFKKGNFYFIGELIEDDHLLHEFKENKNLAHLVFNDYVAQIVNEEKEPQLNLEIKG